MYACTLSYLQNTGGGIDSLASQMGHLQLSGSTGGSSYSGGHQHYPHHLSAPNVAAAANAGSTATLPTHTAHYTAQPPGWTISPTTHYVQQVCYFQGLHLCVTLHIHVVLANVLYLWFFSQLPFYTIGIVLSATNKCWKCLATTWQEKESKTFSSPCLSSWQHSLYYSCFFVPRVVLASLVCDQNQMQP